MDPMNLEVHTQEISLEEIFPLIQESLNNGQEVLFTPGGMSMLPLLRNRRDKVILVSPSDVLCKGDIVFYRRRNRQFVLHRIVQVESSGRYTLCGDGQWTREPGIERSQIIARVKGFYRNGKYIDCTTSWGYLFYCRVWSFLFPFRPIFFRTSRLLCKLYHDPLFLLKRTGKKSF